MKIKYNRVSTVKQSGDRFEVDKEKYDLVLFNRISGSVPFRDRSKGQELVNLVESGKVSELHLKEMSRIGRNTGDCISTLDWLDSHEVNVVIRNLGLQSRPGGKKNPVWKMISSVMSSLFELKVDAISERTAMGRQIYVQRGGILGRPVGSTESERQFIQKEKTQAILKLLKKGRSTREIAAITKCSYQTVMKAKRVGGRFGLLSMEVD